MRIYMCLTSRLQSIFWLVVVLLLSGCQQSSWHKENDRAKYYVIDKSVGIDQALDELITPYRDSISKEMSKVIGVASQELTSEFPEGLLSNFVSDLILEECHLDSAVEVKPDFSLINIRGLRVPLQKGDITVGNIYQLMPFENEIVCLTITPSQLLELFNHMASVGGEGIGGATFGIKKNKAINIKIGGLPLEERNYVVVTSDYLADGGDHFDILKSAIVRNGTGLKVRDAIMQHIQRLTHENQTINSHLDKRIYNAEQ